MTGLYKIGEGGTLQRVYMVRIGEGGALEWLPGDEPTGPVRLGVTRARVLGFTPPVRLGITQARVLGFPWEDEPDPEPAVHDLENFAGSLDGGYSDATVYLRIRLDDTIPDGTTYAMLAILDGGGVAQVRLVDGVWSSSPAPFAPAITGPPIPGRVVVISATITGPIREDRGLWIGRASASSTVLPGVVERAIVYEQVLHDEATQAGIIATLTDPDPVRLGVVRARVLGVPTVPIEPDPDPEPDPEPTGLPLPWGLPTDWDPTVIPAAPLVTIDTPGDYLIEFPDEPFANPFEVYVPANAPDGIRVAIVGGHVSTTGTQLAPLKLNGQGVSFLHVEGLRLSGEDNRDGIRGDFRKPGSIVQLQNIRVDRLRGNATDHADILQIWAGPARLRIAGLHGVTDYQGLILHPRQFGPWFANPETLGEWDLRDIWVEFVDDSAGTAYYSWHDEPTGNPQITTQGLYSTADRTLPPNISSGSPGVWDGVHVGQAPTGSLFTATPGAGYTPTGYDPPPEPEPDPVRLGVARARVMAVAA